MPDLTLSILFVAFVALSVAIPIALSARDTSSQEEYTEYTAASDPPALSIVPPDSA